MPRKKRYNPPPPKRKHIPSLPKRNYNLKNEIFGNIFSGFTFGAGSSLGHGFINSFFGNNTNNTNNTNDKNNDVKCENLFNLYNQCLFKNTSACNNLEKLLLINKCKY